MDLKVTDPGFSEQSLADLGRFRGTSQFTGMHRQLCGASVLVATKPAELTTGLRMLEVQPYRLFLRNPAVDDGNHTGTTSFFI